MPAEPPPGAVVIWKRGADTNQPKEADNMATATTTPETTDDELSPGAQAALARAQAILESDPDETTLAREVLEPYASEEPIREALLNVIGLVSGGDGSEGSELSKASDPPRRPKLPASFDGHKVSDIGIDNESGQDDIAKALERVDGEIARLQKSEEPGSSLALEKYEQARRDLQTAYVERHSGYPGSTTARGEAARRAA
jgi:hypothetical protein